MSCRRRLRLITGHNLCCATWVYQCCIWYLINDCVVEVNAVVKLANQRNMSVRIYDQA